MRFLAGFAALAAALMLTVAGCGGSEASDTETTASAPTQSDDSGDPPRFGQGGPGFDEDAFDELQQCLEANGVTLPSPGQGNGPPSGGQGRPPEMSEELQKAFEACGDYLPQRPQGQGDFGFQS